MPFKPFFCLLISTIALGLDDSNALAQVERNELGKRLQRFERAWQTAKPEVRRQCVPPMSRAVRSFFSMQLADAAEQLDAAWFIARDRQPDEFERHALALSCRPSLVACEVGQQEIRLQIDPFYKSGELPDVTRIEFSVCQPDGDPAFPPQTALWSTVKSEGWSWNPGELTAGDYVVRLQVTDTNQIVELPPSGLSLIRDFDKRLNTLEDSLKDQRGKLDDTLFATSKNIARLLRSLQAGNVQETDYPANHLLWFAERMMEDEAVARVLVAELSSQRDLWLTLGQQRKRVPVRIRAPENQDEKLPVLFLFHGAGGSENMFFETCGAGRCVQLGTNRGWLVVAPRQTGGRLALDIPQLLDELEKFYSLDRSQVFLVGHSMGAGQIVQQLARHPQVARAAVALGGGGRVADYNQLTKPDWFVAAGEYDFGRNGAAALSRQLKAAGAEVDYREFEDVEHMVIVQAATDDLIRFLDAAADAAGK